MLMHFHLDRPKPYVLSVAAIMSPLSRLQTANDFCLASCYRSDVKTACIYKVEVKSICLRAAE
jgi:hypothetical protein